MLDTREGFGFLDGKWASLEQADNVYRVAMDIIDSMDDRAIKQAFWGDSSDVDKLINILLSEVHSVINCSSGPLKTASFGYLDKFADYCDMMLRKLNLNYFIMTTLPGFDQSWHTVEWSNEIQIYKKLCVLAARDHSKSFMFSWALPLWNLYRFERPEVGVKISHERSVVCKQTMIITNKYKLSEHFLKMIRDEIESNAYLRELLLPKRDKGWGVEGLATKTGSQLLIGAYDSSLRGFHPGYIIVDDFLTKAVLYSADQRKKFSEVFFSEVVNMSIPGGHINVVGTPFHQADLYSEIRNAKEYAYFEYPAIFPDGTILCPQRYGLSAIKQRRETIGSLKFAREILLKPVASESSIFPYDIVSRAFFQMDLVRVAPNKQSFGVKLVKVAIGCDFAISASVGADYTCFVVLGKDEFDTIYFMWMYRERGVSYDVQMINLKALNSAFQPDVIVIETNAFQKVMYDMALQAGLPVVGENTGVNKYDYDQGLPALATLFEQGKFKMPRGDQQSLDMTDIVAGEFMSITWAGSGKLESTSEHDDTAMACWQGVKGLRYVHSNFSYDFI